MAKEAEKEEAIRMRREGKTYNEIMDKVSVAKSTLAIWFTEQGLAKSQEQRMTALRAEVQKRGARARRENRLSEIEIARNQGMRDVGRLTARELWLVGIALHWTEGSKQSRRDPSTGIVFGNMDHKMLSVFLSWLDVLGVEEDDIALDLYVHTTRFHEAPTFVTWWSEVLSIPEARIKKVYKKKGTVTTNRTNAGDLYHGLIRIKVKKSTTLNRQAHGWFEALYSATK